MTDCDIREVLAAGGIRYSQSWEDSRLLTEGLRVDPAADVLSITAAGDNVLALLLEGPRSVTAVDLNPAQQALLELKLAGVRVLDPRELAALVGARRAPDPLVVYRALRGELAAPVRAFFDAHEAHLAHGLLGCGRLELYVATFRERVLQRLVPADAIVALLAAESPAAQAEIFARHFDTPAFRDAFRAYFGREELARAGRSEEQFRFVQRLDVGGYFWERFRAVCTERPLGGNFYLEYLLTGGYADLAAGPLYLRPAHVARLAGLVDRVRVVTSDLAAVLTAAPAGTYSHGNLSDLFEYLSPEETDRLFGTLARTLRPGGRIAYWNLLVPRASPPALRPPLQPQADLGARLGGTDRSFLYRAFHVEVIAGTAG